MTDRHVAIAHLFRSIAHAHHRAFAVTNGEDPEWPEWYARELVAPLSSLLGSPVEIGYLAATLRNLDQEMRRKAPSTDWTLYYADRFLTRQLVT